MGTCTEVRGSVSPTAGVTWMEVLIPDDLMYHNDNLYAINGISVHLTARKLVKNIEY